MNAAAKALTHQQWALEKTFSVSLSKRGLFVSSIIMAILVSAIALIYSQDLSRRLTDQLQRAEQNAQQLQVRSGQLVLEQSTFARQQRLQRIAKSQLGLQAPSRETIIHVDTP